jgi:ubiquinone/menaquinone biosynthesis C-methylase UbiE
MMSTDRYLRLVSSHAGRSVPRGARVLDFGCGTGSTVHTLIDAGYDAWGADIVDPWGEDERLKLIATAPYRLPFPDAHFDFIISEQVMEHVFDYDRVFSELRRVLKPSGLSIHHFPGPLYYYEGHINVPLVLLCSSRLYLAAWALIRSRRMDGRSWREVYAQFESFMRLNNYVAKRRLRRAATRASLDIAFLEGSELFSRSGKEMSLLRRLGAGVASPFLQRLMVLSPRASGAAWRDAESLRRN